MIELTYAKTPGIFPAVAPVSYWPICFSCPPLTVPEVFAKVNSSQFPSRNVSSAAVYTVRVETGGTSKEHAKVFSAADPDTKECFLQEKLFVSR